MTPQLLFAVLDFYREPARFAQFRDPLRPLPKGVSELLAVPTANLSTQHRLATEAALGAPADEVNSAVRFFVCQALLEVHSDHYRTLGVPRNAPVALIKQHYHYLMRMFHPDRDVEGEGEGEGGATQYAPRINEAWQVLRHGEKRAAYDRTLTGDDLKVGARGATGAARAAGATRSGNAAAPAAAPPSRKWRASLPAQRRWYTAPWPYALVVVLALLAGLGLFIDPAADRLTIAEPAETPVPSLAPGDSVRPLQSGPNASAGQGEPPALRNIEADIAARVAAAAAAVRVEQSSRRNNSLRSRGGDGLAGEGPEREYPEGENTPGKDTPGEVTEFDDPSDASVGDGEAQTLRRPNGNAS